MECLRTKGGVVHVWVMFPSYSSVQILRTVSNSLRLNPRTVVATSTKSTSNSQTFTQTAALQWYYSFSSFCSYYPIRKQPVCKITTIGAIKYLDRAKRMVRTGHQFYGIAVPCLIVIPIVLWFAIIGNRFADSVMFVMSNDKIRGEDITHHTAKWHAPSSTEIPDVYLLVV